MEKKTKIILIVLAIIAVLGILCVIGSIALSLIAMNPSQAFERARDVERNAELLSTKMAITQYVAEGNDLSKVGEVKDCRNGYTIIGTAGFDLASVLVDDYMPVLPTDPLNGTAQNTGYTICLDGEDIVLTAPKTEGEEKIQVKVTMDDLDESSDENETDPESEETENETPGLGEALVKARNTQRMSNVTAIVTAMSIYIASESTPPALPTCDSANTEIGTAGVDLASMLVPEYISEIPVDPAQGSNAKTGYTICKKSDSRIQVSALYAEEGEVITVTR